MDKLTRQEAALLYRAGSVLDSGSREAWVLMAEALEGMTAEKLLSILEQVEGRAA